MELFNNNTSIYNLLKNLKRKYNHNDPHKIQIRKKTPICVDTRKLKRRKRIYKVILQNLILLIKKD